MAEWFADMTTWKMILIGVILVVVVVPLFFRTLGFMFKAAIFIVLIVFLYNWLMV